MTMKYYVDTSGAYLGGFDGCSPPDGAVEVPTAPVDARDVWRNGAWDASDREFDDAWSDIEARFYAKLQAMNTVLYTILLRDGDQQEAKLAVLRQQYLDAVADRQAELDALWEG